MKGKRRCASHGGKTPTGTASPHWRHGKKTRQPVKSLGDLYNWALADPVLFHYRHDAALLETLRRRLTLDLDPSKPVPADVEKRLLDLSDGLRKIKESEQRRLQLLENSVPLDQHRKAMMTAADIVVRVLDRNTEAVRAALEAAGVDGRLVNLVNPAKWRQEMQHEMRLAMVRTPAVMIEAQPAE